MLSRCVKTINSHTFVNQLVKVLLDLPPVSLIRIVLESLYLLIYFLTIKIYHRLKNVVPSLSKKGAHFLCLQVIIGDYYG